MAPKLTEEQRQAVRQRDSVKVEDDETRKVYFIIDGDLHDRAMQALAEHDTRRAIQVGIDDLTAGRVVSFSEIDSRLRAKFGLSARA